MNHKSFRGQFCRRVATAFGQMNHKSFRGQFCRRVATAFGLEYQPFSLSLLFLRIFFFFNNLLSKISSHREEGISLADYRNPTSVTLLSFSFCIVVTSPPMTLCNDSICFGILALILDNGFDTRSKHMETNNRNKKKRKKITR